VDVFEVSNGEYKKCVSARDCVPPSSESANRYSNYYNNDYLLTYPVLNVTWEMARKYCEWRGARLPTEAEWEKAARGIYERTYPWSNDTDSYIYEPEFYTNRANVNLSPGTYISTVPVSSNLKGLSPYGLYNMAGNVAEWVYDWYGDNYYSTSPYENPTGPGLGESKVIRGGSVNERDVRTTARSFMMPTEFETGVGFRCAKDAP
jgi:formylglycine-generating enzyme required for sulfatase activity